MDKLHYDFVEEHTPIARKTRLLASTFDSLTRPEIIRFQKRLRERFTTPDYGKVLLLLPCSARKPYSSSKSHQAFMFALINSKNSLVVHEVIVTSPLGIVPRELELAYPAQHYDIPVTGMWYEEEKEIIRSQLRWLVENSQYKSIIAHIDEDLSFAVEGLEHVDFTGGKNPTSKESLSMLTSTLNDVTADCQSVSPHERRNQMLTTLMKFHFGSEAGTRLTEGVEFKGHYPYLKMFYKGDQLGMIEGSTGLISLTLAGGERMLESGVYWIEIDDFEMKGDVFAPAVRDADPVIRPFDEVVVFTRKNGGKILKAVGRAAMSGHEMVEAEKGRAVKVRHFIKG
jgi:archaeosine synthase